MSNRFNAAFLLLLSSAAFAAPKPGDFFTQGPVDQKRLALSFDDGPGVETDRFVDLLARHNVKATFFMLGDQTQTRPAMAKKVADAGHEIASHLMAHVNFAHRARALGKKRGEGEAARQEGIAQAKKELIASMRKSREVLEAATGAKVTLLRMPNGVDRPWVKEAAKYTGYILVNWTYGSDWTKIEPATMTAEYVKAIKPGAILLMHDGNPHREHTLAAAEAVIVAAKEQGFEIVTVGELIGAK